MVRFLVFLLSCALVAAGAWWFLKHEGQGQAAVAKTAAKNPISVIIAEVSEENFTTDVQAIGTVQAEESTDIMPNVTETITELHFDDGQSVKKGTVLAVLSDAEEQAQLASARSSLAEEEREIARLESLVKEGAASEARLEERRTLAEVAKQRIREAEAKVADRRVLAPFDGVLGLRRISVGALVSPTTVIARLDKIDVVKIDFSVPETVLPVLKVGTEIAAQSAAAGGNTFMGKLAHLDSRIDPVTRSVPARAEVENKSRALKPGMLVMVKIAMEPKRSLAVPERALVPVGSKAYVFTIDSQTARRIEIKPGRRRPGLLEVIEGLEKGQTVITDGLVGLQDGMEVKVAGKYAGAVKPFNPEQPRVTK
ncbi:MAG: efflux RND transporter periplasmic adaptor subunit [Verrucomicrobiaceae bacterium]|nr:efflux RND transporter periplasmic adaptor subunit [Verrucomicrobiaceae bacterium]